MRQFFDTVRPYDDYAPGPTSRLVMETVRDTGFEYAFTKSAFGPVPRASTVGTMVVMNHTSGRWDGWTPFVTVNSLADLRLSERRLLNRRRPGWLVGALDTCLWAFTGPVWQRGQALYRICDWVAHGGSSGRLINVTPATVARYARILLAEGIAEELQMT